MKMKRIKKFLVGVVLIGILYVPNIFSEATIGVNVNIKPVLMLEVLTPSHIYRSAGSSGALLNTRFNMNENPVVIRVRLSIPKGQTVQLQVQTNSNNIAWHAKGKGFQDGILSKDSPQIMAEFNESGYYEGIVNYYWVNSPSLPQNFTQIITYTLIIV